MQEKEKELSQSYQNGMDEHSQKEREEKTTIRVNVNVKLIIHVEKASLIKFLYELFKLFFLLNILNILRGN